ncbi:grc3 [Drechmeria coniospora]|uniref:Polynucleotide 5'-hydroxyl-kinase GRC3 n=1 Tax=Drechmeria coniospora TaxID=98403 RepID=A0A151GUH8_DRECN|nr:grc3 [Drechmeria coniospora]KYK60765.1 grc3 [Drechmeria coniospora]
MAGQAVNLSSFRLTKQNSRAKADGIVEVRLTDSEVRVSASITAAAADELQRFLVLGSFGLRVLSGEITVAGATIRPSDRTHWIHAPQCHALPVMRTAEETRFEMHNDPTADGLRKLGRLSPLFRGIWHEPQERAGAEASKAPCSYRFLSTSEDGPKRSVIQELVSPPKWNRKLASLMESTADGGREPLTVLVCGPKSAGKSTFSKLLTNRLLTWRSGDGGGDSACRFPKGVAVLDLDPGQPEYAPPGTVSLVHVTRPNLGVPFTHPSLDDEAYKVVRCHSMASVNPASGAELHLECATDLHDHYRRTLRHCPLVVNTPGWVLSLGLELLVQIIHRMRPAEVIYMSEEGPAETVEALQAVTKNVLVTLPSQQSEFASRTAAHFRDMQTMSYFHTHTLRPGPREEERRQEWTASALSSIRPLAVRYAGGQRGFLGVLRYDYQVPAHLLAEAINGTVLAVVEIEAPEAFRGLGGSADGGPTLSRTREGIPFVANPNDVALDPRHSRTIGLALVRGIDTAGKTLQVLTPMPVAKIAEARSQGHSIVFVHGKFDAPTWSYAEHLHEEQADDDDGDGDASPDALEAADEDMSDDDAKDDVGYASDARDGTAVPWVEVLRGSQKRPVGSRVWRVRRDLGRGAGD